MFQGKLEEALRAFETLVQLHPQSPRARYGKAQVPCRQRNGTGPILYPQGVTHLCVCVCVAERGRPG